MEVEELSEKTKISTHQKQKTQNLRENLKELTYGMKELLSWELIQC